MLEIINDVLSAEKKAESLVARAQEESLRLQAAYDQEERERVQKARSDENERILNRISQIKKEAEDSSLLLESQIHEKADQFLREHEKTLSETAEAVRLLVLTSRTQQFT